MPGSTLPLEPYRSVLHFFGAELRHRRTQVGLTIAVLSGKVFVSKAQLAMVETGQRFPSLDLAVRCDDTLDAGGALVRLQAFAAAERARLRDQNITGSYPAELAHLLQLLAGTGMRGRF